MNIKSLGVRKHVEFAGLAPAVTEALRCPRSAAGADILAPWAEAASCWAVGMHVLRAAGQGGMKGKASAKVPCASPGLGGHFGSTRLPFRQQPSNADARAAPAPKQLCPRACSLGIALANVGPILAITVLV